MGIWKRSKTTCNTERRIYRCPSLSNRSLANEKIEFGEETYDAVWLLSKFIQMSLQSFPKIDGIVFRVPVLTEELAQMLRGIAVRMNIDKRHIFIQDYKESFVITLLSAQRTVAV